MVGLALADGGYFRRTWPWATLALAAVAAGVPLLSRVGRLAAAEIAFVGGLVALAGWQALSSEWSPDPDRSLDDALRGTVYVAGSAALLVLARAGWPRRLLAGLAVGIAVTLVVGIVEHAGAPRDPFEGSALFQPVGYTNAVGILAVVAALTALGLLLDARDRLLRGGCAAVVAIALFALVLTGSRGALLAGGLGLATAAVFLLRGDRPWALPAWLGVVAALVAGILVSPLVVEPSRLAGVLSDRAYYWPVAWHALGARGIGAGGFAQLWALERPVPADAIDAHSLFLETLLELGVLGLVLVVATLALPLVVARRSTGGWAAGAVGAYTAFLVHAAYDWDWEMPLVTLAGLACGAAVLAAGARKGAAGG